MVSIAYDASVGAVRRDADAEGRVGIDRWIFVLMAAWFIVLILAGFIPDSLRKIAAVQSGARPPFPMILHMHAVLMGSFLALLLGQSWLVATGRRGLHMQLGLVSLILVPAIVIVGFMLVPTMYHELMQSAQTAAPDARAKMQAAIARRENVLLLQLRMGLLFPLFVTIGLLARRHDSGLHRRLMFLGTAVTLSTGIDRMTWLPNTFPVSPLGPDLYTLAAVAPMFLWDVVRQGGVHRAYLIWFAVAMVPTIAVHGLWNTAWWHAASHQLLGG